MIISTKHFLTSFIRRSVKSSYIYLYSHPNSKMFKKYSTRTVGSLYTEEYKIYLEDSNGNLQSYFHDVPLYADEEKGILNAVTEIPRWTNGKLEISKDDLLNPIKQDISKGKVRFVNNIYPFNGYMWNYGALPQTWESPLSLDPQSNRAGDNDPLDIIEIGSRIGKTGEITQVKVLGAISLIDGGEADWKIIVIDINDPKANLVNDHVDIEKHFPGLLDHTKWWFRVYKIPEGKPINELSHDGKTFDKGIAFEIIGKCHEAWKELINNSVPSSSDKYKIEMANTTQKQSKYITHSSSDAIRSIPSQNILPTTPVPDHVHTWHFIKS